MPLRIDDIQDLGIAKQVATLFEAENARLHTRLEALARENAELKGEGGDKQLELELLRLKEQMAALQRQLYGASSERRSRDKDAPAAAEPPEAPSGPRAQRDLALEEHVHELGPDERCCKTCGREMVEWQGQDEQTEEADVVQRLFVIRRDIRKKYRCQCGASPKRAPGPLRLPSGGRYSLNFAVEVAVGKWSDHLPLERQVRIMRREVSAVMKTDGAPATNFEGLDERRTRARRAASSRFLMEFRASEGGRLHLSEPAVFRRAAAIPRRPGRRGQRGRTSAAAAAVRGSGR